MPRTGITKREAQVLYWVIQGKRDAEIAAILGGSAPTIHKHVQRLLKKLHAETRTAAALRATELGPRSGTPPLTSLPPTYAILPIGAEGELH